MCVSVCVCLMTNVTLLLLETGKEAEEGEAHWSCDYSRDLVPSRHNRSQPAEDHHLQVAEREKAG